MTQIFISSILLSLIHASIPNHWLPLIAIGKTQNWSERETLFGTMIAGFAHTLSTIFIGIIVGFFGFTLSSSYALISTIIAPAILAALGLIYLIVDFTGKKHDHFVFSAESMLPEEQKENSGLQQSGYRGQIKKQKTKWAILFSLSLSMFLSPCLEIEAYYFQASTLGWMGIWVVSCVYTVITVSGMCLLVYLGMRGVKHIRSHILEKHEKKITGFVLICIGLLTYFLHF